MKLLNIFREPLTSLVDVKKYPDAYIIETCNSTDTGIWIRSEKVSVHPIGITLEELEKNIIMHLNKSRRVKYKRYDPIQIKRRYAEITNKKTIHEQMKDAQLVSVYKHSDKIELTPYINGGPVGRSKGYEPIEEKKEIININDNIASKIKKLFNECR